MDKPELTNDQTDVENVDVTSPVITDTTHTSDFEDEGRKGAIARIAELLRGSKATVSSDEPVDDATDEPESDVATEPEGDEVADSEDDVPPADEYEEIDPRFVAAAHTAFAFQVSNGAK